MYSIKQFLSEFGNIIFDEHLELILKFERKYLTPEYYDNNNNTPCSQMCPRDGDMKDTCVCFNFNTGDVTDTCSCFTFEIEKEKIMSLIDRYYKLSKYFTTPQNVMMN